MKSSRLMPFLKGLPLHLPSEHKLQPFLTVQAQKDVAVSAQNQAFNAIISRIQGKPQRKHCGVSILQFHPGTVHLQATR